ncbi:fimbrial protein [Aeromonas dhakensis]|uniref:fimbrial protein n=1 Tax=Aeromonas dhakensis TaxID=196024 RepID=UPI00111A133C|nr:fimbrial protein [Aeromonas dhakensis]TNI56701.1 fimbrial protein [Aeromonas dhakensis]
MNKTTVASAIMMVMLSSSAFAAEAPKDQGHGVIKFVGSIIDAPCSISQESLDQTIQMGQVANSLLEQQGETPLRPFEIKLESCSLETAKDARITFKGTPDKNDAKHLAITGTGKGAGIALVNLQDNAEIPLTIPTKVSSLVEGDNLLKFGAKLVSNVKSGDKATPGEFSATSDFIMTYQ